MKTDNQEFMVNLKRRMEAACIADRGGLRPPTVAETKAVNAVTVREGQGNADYPLEIWRLLGVKVEAASR